MQIPKFWAEARRQRRTRERQVTVRRFGWSDESQEAAQRHAEERVEQAFEEVWAGKNLRRRERKVAYNGAEGLPIREEIAAEHGDTVITRNSYGALCLNTPDVLFADIDFPNGSFIDGPVMLLYPIVTVVSVLALWPTWGLAALLVIPALLLLLAGIAFIESMYKVWLKARGVHERGAMQRIESFMDRRNDWQVRIYRTPNGYRVLAMHDVFDPSAETASQFFSALNSDKVYVTMCRRQQCFRARVSPKPWRAGIPRHLKPRPGVWPINPERLPDREAWIAEYEQACEGYASCEYVTTLGLGASHPKAREVQELHDRLSRATSGLPIA